MSATQRPVNSDSMVLLGTGTICFLFGLFMLSARSAFASFFLNANFLFGIPLTGDDALKVLFVGFGSVVAIGMGVLLLVVGLFRFGDRNGTAQGNPAPATHL